MSASPEMARRGSPVRVRSQPDLRNTLAALSSVTTSAPVLRPVSFGQVEVSNKVEKSQVVPQEMADADFDGYMAQTEKEIRRLIKYGQKWREYSRRQDAENARLKGLVEDLQRENERLRRKGDTGSENVKPPRSISISATTTQPKPESKPLKQTHQSFDFESTSSRKEPDKWKIPLASFDSEKQRCISISTLIKKPEESFRDIPSISKDAHKPARQPESATNPDKNIFKYSSIRQPYQNSAQQQREEKPAPKEQGPSKSISRDVPDHAPHLSKPVTESSSEADRKAAARERLRLKREAKVASVRASSAPVLQGSKSGHDPLKDDNEESQVDWMALS